LLYAAYGSNLHPRRLRERIAAARLVGTSFLKRYTLQFHKRGQDQSAKCAFTDCGRGMHVAVYELGPGDRQTLDRIEGVGKGYEVSDVDVPGFGRCFTYAAAHTHIDAGLQPFDWYRDMVLLGCLWHAFPARYCERIAAVPVVGDPDRRRRNANRALLARLREHERHE